MDISTSRRMHVITYAGLSALIIGSAGLMNGIADGKEGTISNDQARKLAVFSALEGIIGMALPSIDTTIRPTLTFPLKMTGLGAVTYAATYALGYSVSALRQG